MTAGRAARDLLLGTMLLLLMCVVGGRPQVFSDTKAYYALGQEIVGVFTPHSETSSHAAVETLRGKSLAPSETRTSTRLAYTVAASRSPYWSALFYLAVTLGTGWLVVMLQAAVGAGVLWLACRNLGAVHAYLPMVALLALLSSLPVTIMFLMPDVFAGLAILAAAVLASRWDGLSRRGRTLLWLVMAAGALFHTSHLLILLGLGVATLLVALLWRTNRVLLRPGLAMLLAAVVGMIGALAFPLTVKALRGESIYAPPFIAARLIADGPGRAVLREDCRAGDVWGWCPYIAQPLSDVNTILWDDSAGAASFQAADYQRRVRIIDEQGRFALAVVSRYPAEVVATAGANVAHLFVRYGTHEMLDDPSAVYRNPEFRVFTRIVPGTEACFHGRTSCGTRLDLDLLDAVIGATLLLAWVAAIVLLATERRQRRAWMTTALVILAGLTLNAVVCGAISGNAERYQSRVTWLVPFLALALAGNRLRERKTAG